MTTEPENNLKSQNRLEALESYHSPQVDVEVRLNTNEAPYPPPPKFQKMLVKQIQSLDLNRYPDSQSTNLKNAIADSHRVDAGKVIVGNGSNEVIQFILAAYGNCYGEPSSAGLSNTGGVKESSNRSALLQGKVAVFEPTYAMHSHISQVAGAQIIKGTRTDKWEIGVAELEQVLEQEPDIVFLCSPNNPTGCLDDPKCVAKLAEGVAEQGSILVIDEAYAGFDLAHRDLLEQDFPVVLVRTFSKNWSLAGARLGYGIAPKWVVANLEKVILPYNVNAISQLAGELILNFKSELESRYQTITEERELLIKRLREAKVFQVWDSYANFVLFKVVGEGLLAKNIWEALIDRSILLRYYPSSPHLNDCLRVTVGTPEENSRFLDAIYQIINERG